MKVLLLALLPAAALAAGPLEKNHPLVAEGMQAFEKGDYEAALGAFDRAKAALPDNALVEFNRGAALHKLGRNEEARSALMRAADLDPKHELTGPIHYNLGNAWAATGNKKEAIAEYRKALRADPSDQLSRHNMEVLLRDIQRQQQNQGQDGGTPDAGAGGDAGRPDAGTDGGKPQDGGRPEDGGNKPDGGTPDGGGDGGSDGGQSGGDGGQGDGGQGDGGTGKKDQQGDGGQGQGADGGKTDGGQSLDAGQEPQEDAEAAEVMDGGSSMSKKDAEKLLDSMKNSEKNLQLWRFQQKRQKKPNGKDW
jgi:tetratricopeptide (TPR) repeat protein